MNELTGIKGIGEKRAALMGKLGITDVESLLRYFPTKYEDRSKNVKIEEAQPGEDVCIRARIFTQVRENRIRRNMTIYRAIVCDDTDSLAVVWYNNRYVKNAFSADTEYVFFGKLAINRGRREMVNPVYERADRQRFTGGIVPIYRLCEGLSQTAVRSAVEAALEQCEYMPEYLPERVRREYMLAELNFSLKNIHFPSDAKAYELARRRFVFEELLTLRLALMLKKGDNRARRRTPFECTDGTEFIASLPFEPTGAQKRVMDDIVRDLASDTAMSRLVQGDVGSGKTAVAAYAMYLTVKNGMQAALMAPTEILAVQHYSSFCKLLEPFGIRVVLLTSSSKNKKATLEEIADGRAQVIIGTHAVIQKNVEFKNLALCVTDEQHRFGVAQRSRLIDKGENVNVLVMTATPIPRTLALILYGDLNVSVIDELPPGRKPVKTYAVGEDMRRRVYAFLEKNIRAGMQGYVVCPLVEETSKSDLENAAALCERLRVIFPDFRVGLIHGRMKPSEKSSVMEDFVGGKTDILVSTTVIEVGVNVPSANIMIIENAERFGLSQLHQLRGRVGRGEEEASCILIAHGNGDVVRSRMETMRKSNDGFYIAEQDLKLRGPGDFFGTRQHGLPELKIANLFEDTAILSLAQRAAEEIFAADPGLLSEENAPLKKRIDMIVCGDTVMN